MSSDEDSDNVSTLSTSTQRRAPLTPTEKSLLLQLVKKYKGVVENKQSDKAFAYKKDEMWKQISAEFNAQDGLSRRDAKQLRKCWENQKTTAKKEVSKHKRRTFKTGGGLSPPKLLVTTLEVISIIPGQITTRPLINEFDSDARLAANENDENPNTSAATDFPLNFEPLKKKPKIADTKVRTRSLPLAQEQLLDLERELHCKRLELLNIKIRNEEETFQMQKTEHSMRKTLLEIQLKQATREF